MSKPSTRYYYILLTIPLILIIFFTFSLSGVDKEKSIELPRLPSIKLKPLGRGYKDQIFNLTLKYVTNSKPCHQELLALFIVTSYYANQETRSAMRRAYPQAGLLKDLKIRRVFLLGQVLNSTDVKQESIADEARRFGDIVQGNFIEAYRNLTYKHIMGLKWASDNCHRAKYIIKMDDDIVVNLEKFVKNVLINTTLPTNLVAGYILRQMKPIREPFNKWYVSDSEYVGQSYPPFASGWLYVTTPKIASKFFLLSHYVDYLWIDDLYVTGILASQLKIKHFDLRRFYTVFPEVLQCCLNDVHAKRLDCDILIGPNGGDNNLFFEFNQAMRVCAVDNACNARVRPINETCVAERKVNIGKGSGAIENYKLH